MYVVMITGGIGSGKSTLRKLMCEHGAVSIDLDQIARTLMDNEQQMVDDLVDEFGSQILEPDGTVNRAALAAVAFASDEATQAMNAITFPYIMREANEYVLNVHCTPRTNAKVLVVEVPLLTDMPQFIQLADEVIAVAVSQLVRLERCVDRGMTAQDALARMERQPTDAQRAAIADTICDNSGSAQELEAWVDAWWESHEERFA